MALSLKEKETNRLARKVASLIGETLTDAARTALEESLQSERLLWSQHARLSGQP